MTVDVLTASLPSRTAMLTDAMHSVASQTLSARAHLIAIDHERRGSSAMRNQLLRASTADWVAVLDDDDLMLPNHLETLLSVDPVAKGIHIVYSYCKVDGRPGWNPNREFSAEALRRGNFIPSTALISRSMLLTIGGWRPSSQVENGWEDWDLWLRALDGGAHFFCVPEVTWVYRFHNGNKTFVGEEQAS